MALGRSHCSIIGNVGGNITFGHTGNGESCCSFSVAIERRYPGRTSKTVWARCNLYGDTRVALYRERLVTGAYISVEGELMQREGDCGALLEIKVQDILFLWEPYKMESGNGHDASGSELR